MPVIRRKLSSASWKSKMNKAPAEKRILVVGYGSIGKRHVRNLMEMGDEAVVLTQHPDELQVRFIEELRQIEADST